MKHRQAPITRRILLQLLPKGRELEKDPQDGTLSFSARMEDGLLLTGELSPAGTLQINLYQDRHPDPQATIGQIWKLHLPETSAQELEEMIQAHQSPEGAAK